MKKRITAILLALAVIFTIGSFSVFAVDNTETAYKLKAGKKTVYIGSKYANKLQGAKGKVTWKTSNKKIATVTKKGVIKGIKPGKCIVSAKYKGKTYKCSVTVARRQPDFDAKIVNVKRNKSGTTVVSVRIRNLGSKPLTILQKASYRDMSEPTYKIKLSSSKGVQIKAKKAKTVSFINYGKYDIYNLAGRPDPDIFAMLESKVSYSFKYDGKKYSGVTYWYTETDDETYYETYYYKSLYTKGGKRVATAAKKR